MGEKQLQIPLHALQREPHKPVEHGLLRQITVGAAVTSLLGWLG